MSLLTELVQNIIQFGTANHPECTASRSLVYDLEAFAPE
jgi:hypothetical protein